MKKVFTLLRQSIPHKVNLLVLLLLVITLPLVIITAQKPQDDREHASVSVGTVACGDGTGRCFTNSCTGSYGISAGGTPGSGTCGQNLGSTGVCCYQGNNYGACAGQDTQHSVCTDAAACPASYPTKTNSVACSGIRNGNSIQCCTTNTTNPTNFYGTNVQFLTLLGQQDVTQTSIHASTSYGIYHAGGVVVDKSSTPNKVYVMDPGNNRILGYNGIGYCSNQATKACTIDSDCGNGATCKIDGTKPVDIIIGQPDATHGACNKDNNLGINAKPDASSLCLLGYPNYVNNVSEEHNRFMFDVDTQGNLYVPDRWNNRILKYNQPLSATKTNGNGDAIADFVWGQDDFVSNGNNRGSYFGTPNKPDDHSLFISHDTQSLTANVSTRGVSVDAQNNIWVADTFNNRVIRFPANGKNADIVLGQPDFTSTGCKYDSNNPTTANLNSMCNPTEAKIRSDTGDLYVLDEYPTRYSARILVFKAPFTNGMSAYRVIVPKQTFVTNPSNPSGPKVAFVNWTGFDGKGSYQFQSWGFTFNPLYNPKSSNPLANGVLWINENETKRTILLDDQNNIITVIGAPDQNHIGGDSGEYGGSCGSIDQGFRLFEPGGQIGFDAVNNIYLADDWNHRISRYALPYIFQSNKCPPEPNGGLYPGVEPNVVTEDKTGVLKSVLSNVPTDSTFGEFLGLTVFQNQLITSDNTRTHGGSLKFWNNYTQKPFGAPPDGVIADDVNFTIPGNTYLNNAIDDLNRLWIFNNKGQLRVYQLPLTNNEAPLADNIPLVWSDTNSPISYNGSPPSGIAYDKIHKKLYIDDKTNSRILRISNYTTPTNKLTVDMVLGQPDKQHTQCNHNQTMPWEASGDPTADSLCYPNQITFDQLGNLYVIDNFYECHGNDRITTFLASDLQNAQGLFPNLQAKKAFIGTLTAKGPCAYTALNEPGSPISIAFNSKNNMVVSNDGYYGDIQSRPNKQLWIYNDPLNKQTPDASINLPMGAPGEVVFDSNDNLFIQDHSWYKIWGINLQTDPSWLQQVSSSSPSPTVTSNPSAFTFSVSVCPHGLGKCGDNVNPTSSGNTTPKHSMKAATLSLLDSNNQPVTTTQTTLTYNSTQENYQGSFGVTTVSAGQYIASIKVDGYLPKQLPGIITVTHGQSITLPSTDLTTGDINNDNQLDILDYNLLISCFGSKQTSPSCTTPPTQKSQGSDITDDGTVDGADYNLFLRELSVQKGS